MAALLENSSLFLAQPAIQERPPGTIARGLGSFTRLSRRTHACRMHRFAVVHGPGPRPGSLAGRVRSNSETSTSSSVRALLEIYYDERIRCPIALLITQYDGRACAHRRDLRRRPLRTSFWPSWTHPKASPRPPSRPCRQPVTWPSATSCVVKAVLMVFDYFLLGSGRVSIYAESWSRGS